MQGAKLHDYLLPPLVPASTYRFSQDQVLLLTLALPLCLFPPARGYLEQWVCCLPCRDQQQHTSAFERRPHHRSGLACTDAPPTSRETLVYLHLASLQETSVLFVNPKLELEDQEQDG
jgi:hypothetical protein